MSFRVWCSTDGGLTWPRFVGINQGDVAGYSALEIAAAGGDGRGTAHLLAVWENKPTMLSWVLSIDDWCPVPPAPAAGRCGLSCKTDADCPARGPCNHCENLILGQCVT